LAIRARIGPHMRRNNRVCRGQIIEWMIRKNGCQKADI
jgi:hypothetical protein